EVASTLIKTLRCEWIHGFIADFFNTIDPEAGVRQRSEQQRFWQDRKSAWNAAIIIMSRPSCGQFLLKGALLACETRASVSCNASHA
ncbi:hypothetical protein, partial [Mesorhizobium sp. M0898]|uniref:hypothetical protein n=1 Tax=Mesorhizobium sp. M0898 TaxID=2957020 RepID=UPI00333DAF9D